MTNEPTDDELTDRDRAIIWARGILETDFVVLDTETTGLGYDDEAVSIGLVSKTGEILIDTLLCHEKPCDQKALATHGISYEMTRDAPHISTVYPELLDKMAGPVVVGYNAGFDYRIISQTLCRYELWKLDDEWPFQSPNDVMQKFAEFYGDWSDWHNSYTWKRLTFAASYFGVDTTGAHGAAADCILTLRVIEGMAKNKLSTEVDR